MLSAEASPIPEDQPMMPRDRIELGRIFEVTKESALELVCSREEHEGSFFLKPVSITIPESPELPRYLPMLLTGITVFGSFTLGDYDSGLTYPTVLHQLEQLRGGETLEFRFRLGREPGFVCNIIRN